MQAWLHQSDVTMRKTIYVSVIERDIETKQLYGLENVGPVGLAVRRQLNGRLVKDIYTDEVHLKVGEKTYSKTKRTTEICEQSRATGGKIKPCRLAFTLNT